MSIIFNDLHASDEAKESNILVDRSERMCSSLLRLWPDPITPDECKKSYCPMLDPFEHLIDVTLAMSEINKNWSRSYDEMRSLSHPWTDSIRTPIIGNVPVCKCHLRPSIICHDIVPITFAMTFIAALFAVTECGVWMNMCREMAHNNNAQMNPQVKEKYHDFYSFVSMYIIAILQFVSAGMLSWYEYGTLRMMPYRSWLVMLITLPYVIRLLENVCSGVLTRFTRCCTLSFGCIQCPSFGCPSIDCCACACVCTRICTRMLQTIMACCMGVLTYIYQTCFNIVCMCRVLNRLQPDDVQPV
jgi:hypothetical protein